MSVVPIDPARVRVAKIVESSSAARSAFRSGDPDLDEFLARDAEVLHALHVCRTYVAFAEERLAGYVSVLADAIVLTSPERKRDGMSSRGHPVAPAVKIARLAVDGEVRARRSGLGTYLVRFAALLATSLSESVAVRYLTVDAYGAAVPFYERLGFVPNRAKDYRERPRVSMRVDLFGPSRPSWLR